MHNFHPIADIFPMMPEAELSKLAEDIRKNGLREPIWTDQGGRIIDGRNRFLACQSVGVEPSYRPYEGDEADLLAFVISLNLHRRHLSESQRALIAAKLPTLKRGDVASQTDDRQICRPITTPCAAAMLNVGERSVREAKTVLKEGTPEEIKAVEAGEAAASTTAKVIRKRKAAEESGSPCATLPAGGTGRGGSRVAVPEGMALEEWTREIMRCVDKGQSPEEAATDAHMNVDTFRKARAIVLLSDRDDLSAADATKVKAALDGMNETQQVRSYHEQLLPIIERIWGKAGNGIRRDDKTEHRRREDFERRFGMLITSCTLCEKMEIPHLPAERRTEVVAELREAEKQISNLRKRIEA